MLPSQRMQAVQSPIIPVVGELIASHPGTISLGQGVVHYGPPPGTVERAAAAMADGENHKYKRVGGIEPLRRAIADKLDRDNDIALGDRAAMLVTAGGNMAFVNAVLAVTDPGDEVILLRPYYFNHEMAVTIAGAVPVAVDTDEDYQPVPEAIEAAVTNRTRAVVTISPNNPTGAVYPRETLGAINALCHRRGIFHVHDEAYEYFTYGGAEHVSPGSFEGAAGHTISLFSLSKSFGFASWRVGYMVMPAGLLPAVKKIQDTNLICPPVISQHAAVAAMSEGCEYPGSFLPGISEVRRVVLEQLGRIERFCTVPPARGAFYFLLRVDTALRDMEVVERLIRNHGVAVIPGATFGVEFGCLLRVAYGALQKDTAAEGIGRLVKGLETIVGSHGT